MDSELTKEQATDLWNKYQTEVDDIDLSKKESTEKGLTAVCSIFMALFILLGLYLFLRFLNAAGATKLSKNYFGEEWKSWSAGRGTQKMDSDTVLFFYFLFTLAMMTAPATCLGVYALRDDVLKVVPDAKKRIEELRVTYRIEEIKTLFPGDFAE